MDSKFSKLPKTTFSGLEYQNIIEDIIALVKEHPEYDQQYDDFLSSNAGRMLVELFAYITDQLATRIDWVVNENFLSTATQKDSIIKLLKLIGYSLKLPIAAKVRVTLSPFSEIEGKKLAKDFNISSSTTYLPFYLLAEDRNGVKKTFELLSVEDSGKINYHVSPALENEMTFYEGKTYIEDFFIETDNNQIFKLSNPSVIKDSVQVYKIVEDSNQAKELLQVNSFLDPEAQRAIDESVGIPYKINIQANNSVEIEFPSSGVIGDSSRRPSKNEHIRIFYRVGGGINGNIVPRSINFSKKVTLYADTSSESTASISFINNSYGYGGEDEESIETAVLKAPAEIQTVKKTVTEDDYNIVLNSFDEVLLSKSIGNSNEVAYSDALYKKYGRYINPMEVWNFVLMNKRGWEKLTPSEYNDFNWFESRLDNRFNEPVSFKDGENDRLYNLSEKDLIATSLGIFEETAGEETTKININLTYDESYLGYHIVVNDSSNEELIGETRVIVGGSNYIFDLDLPLPHATAISDKYEIINPNSFVLETPQLFKDNTNEENFKSKLTKIKTDTFSFDLIEKILEVDDILKKDTLTITEDVFPFFLSKKNLKSGVSLKAGDITIKIDSTKKTINFPENNYTADDIVEKINLSFATVSTALGTTPFYIKGDTAKNNSEIHNIKYNMSKIRVGMVVKVETSEDIKIEEVHIKDRYIVLEKTMSSSEKQKEFRIEDPEIEHPFQEVASLDFTDSGTYIVLRSHTSGKNASIYVTGDLVPEIFGVANTIISKGVKKLHIDSNKNLIYSYPNNTLYESINVFLQYVVNSETKKVIGDFYSQEGVDAGMYRSKAERVYSTVYNPINGSIDYFNSNFIVKFTKEKVIASSLNSIESDWVLKQNTFPTIKKDIINFANPFVLNIKIDNVVVNKSGINSSDINSLCLEINKAIRDTNFSSNSELYSNFEYAVIDGSEIILRSPTNFGASSFIKVLGSDNIFSVGDESKSSGDYYIKIDENNKIVVYKSPGSNLPDFPFYAHFVFDQRYVLGIYDGENERSGRKMMSIDEDRINRKLAPYKITGIENVYKKPTFKVFDIVGTVTYSKSFSRASIEKSINSSLKKTFNLRNAEIGRSIFKSKITSLIHDIDGVLYFNISYFGLDKKDPTTNQPNMIEAGFDEIILIGDSEDRGIDITYKSE